MTRPTVLLTGADIGARTVWTWQWDDDREPRHAVSPKSVVDSARASLAEALPDPIWELDKTPRPDERVGDRAVVFDLVSQHDPAAIMARNPVSFAVFRSLMGPLADPVREAALSKDLAAAFLPSGLADDLARRGAETPALLRVFPPPSAHAVPWELLPVEDKRLIQVADVVQVAPPLGRDGTDRKPRTWSSASALRVIDPKRPSVVLDNAVTAEEYGWNDDAPWREWTPDILTEELHREDRSRLLWVGHVGSPDGSAGSIGLELSDDNRNEPTRLSAAMLFAGNADVDLTGSQEAWPAPSRVALVACRSGTDMRYIEPFGLVVAFLESGAELVTATRWTLPTDRAIAAVLAHRGGPQPGKGKGPFNQAAHEIDRVQGESDPIRALGDWQRERLCDWQKSGSLVDSPVIWASLANHHAPARTVREE